MTQQIETGEFRKALGSFATGVTIVTTCANRTNFGVTANSFNSVSLDPPMVLWSLARTSSSLAAFVESEHFAVHILADDQESLSNRFATKGIDKFEGLAVERGVGAVPLLPGCAARFECTTAYRYEGGDHIIFVGEVVNFFHSERQPLLFHGGRYAKATRAEVEAEQSELQRDLQADDLSSLVARAYFHLLTPVRQSALRRGISLAEHYALSILMIQGECILSGINDIIGYSGVSVDAAAIGGMQANGFVEVRNGGHDDPLILLTPAGRQVMIELIATAKALEADAQLDFDAQDARLLKQLLRRLVRGLELHGDERVSRHMDLMKQVVHGP